MSTELTMLAWTLVLAIVQIMLPAQLRTREVGLPYNASPRDRPAPVSPGVLTGRLMRAQSNLMETLPLFIAAVLIVQIAQLNSTLTYWGVMLYFWGRVAHVVLYATGVPYVRTLAFLAALAGIIMLLIAILHPV